MDGENWALAWTCIHYCLALTTYALLDGQLDSSFSILFWINMWNHASKASQVWSGLDLTLIYKSYQSERAFFKRKVSLQKRDLYKA